MKLISWTDLYLSSNSEGRVENKPMYLGRNLHTYVAKKEIYLEMFSTTSQTESDIINSVVCSFSM